MPYRGFNIIAITPAGRKQYLELLIPQLTKYYDATLIDEYHLWINTHNEEDINFINNCSKTQSFIKIIHRNNIHFDQGNLRIDRFFDYCIDENNIYIRFDDDIIVCDTIDAFQKFIDFRIDNPQYFLVFGNILNNAVVSYYQQKLNNNFINGHICNNTCADEVGWKNYLFAEKIHNDILYTLSNDKSFDKYYFKTNPETFNQRVSINMFAFFGKDLKKLTNGFVDPDEEEFLSNTLPTQNNLKNIIFGQYCCVHYSFWTTRYYLDKIGMIDNYRELFQNFI
jgi:hypothetical protein